MGHHIDDRGRFQSDKYEWLAPDKVVISLMESWTWPGLRIIAESYRGEDPEFARDLLLRIDHLSVLKELREQHAKVARLEAEKEETNG